MVFSELNESLFFFVHTYGGNYGVRLDLRNWFLNL